MPSCCLHVTFILKVIGHRFQPWLIPLQRTVVSETPLHHREDPSLHEAVSHLLHRKHIPQIGFLRTPYRFRSTFGCDCCTSDGINSYWLGTLVPCCSSAWSNLLRTDIASSCHTSFDASLGGMGPTKSVPCACVLKDPFTELQEWKFHNF